MPEHFVSKTMLVFSTAMVSFAIMGCVYHFSLAAVALVNWRRRSPRDINSCNQFAIIIPAHNEQEVIQSTLDSCSQLDYPADKFEVYVVADNCQDDTAKLVKERGFQCLERFDHMNRGKGHALAWSIPQLVDQPWDAIIVLDADCRIDCDALQVFSACLNSGDLVLQSNNVVSNPDESAVSYLLAVANALENQLFDAPKSDLRLSSRLRGTGMVFHRSIAKEFPWTSGSVVEDAEYGYVLLERCVPVRFVKDVSVKSHSPARPSQLAIQRMRWISGIRSGISHGARVFVKGIIHNQPAWIDAGYTSLIAGRFLIIFQWMVSFSLALACHWQWRNSFTRWSLILAVMIPFVYAIYLSVGVFIVGTTWRRFWLLTKAPYVTVRYLFMALAAIVFSHKSEWKRTPR